MRLIILKKKIILIYKRITKILLCIAILLFVCIVVLFIYNKNLKRKNNTLHQEYLNSLNQTNHTQKRSGGVQKIHVNTSFFGNTMTVDEEE